MLVAKNVRKSYGGKVVLPGLDLTVKPGQITALIGPSGGGKSTTLRTVSLLDPPDSGCVSVDTETFSFPLHNGSPTVWPWPKLTVVFQQLFLWPHLTLRQNIFLPLERNGARSPATEIEDLILFFELSEFIDRFPNQVSLGQRQRTALVRALALRPKYLLLDEITSALDVEHVGKVLAHLQRLRDSGTAILLVTHLIGFAKSAADQIVFLENGQVLASGGRDLIVTPTSERLRKFLSLVETAT